MVEYRRKKEFISRNIAGEVIVVPISGDTAILEKVFGFSETAAFLWNELANPQPVDSLVARLQQDYEVDGETAKRDVEEFLKRLIELGLIEENGAAR
ncbi:MAG: hypothetical protein Kow0090_23060 [Myxococcota bacterium]